MRSEKYLSLLIPHSSLNHCHHGNQSATFSSACTVGIQQSAVTLCTDITYGYIYTQKTCFKQHSPVCFLQVYHVFSVSETLGKICGLQFRQRGKFLINGRINFITAKAYCRTDHAYYICRITAVFFRHYLNSRFTHLSDSSFPACMELSWLWRRVCMG